MHNKADKDKGEAGTGRDLIPGFGAAVRSRREAAGFTLQQLADKAQTGFSALSKVERSLRAPSLRLAAALASALGVTVDVLMLDAARLAGAPVEATEAPKKGKR